MLVLSRRLGEAVFIGPDVRVSIVFVHGRQIGLGFEAPDHVSILREELLPGHPAAAGPPAIPSTPPPETPTP